MNGITRAERARALLVCATLMASGFAMADTYSVDTSHTFPAFEVSHFGMSSQRGLFNKVTGKITIDLAAKSGAADITLNMTGIVTGEPKLADHLRAADFFEVEKHPTATFKSSQFRFEGDRLVSIAGELTLKGVTKPVTLAVNAFKCGSHPFNKKAMCGADASVVIKRSDFGIKFAIPAVSDEVKLSIPVEAFKD